MRGSTFEHIIIDEQPDEEIEIEYEPADATSYAQAILNHHQQVAPQPRPVRKKKAQPHRAEAEDHTYWQRP